LTSDEREALTLYVKAKWKALDIFLRAKQSTSELSSGLVFVLALRAWQKGEFRVAKLLVEAEIARSGLNAEVEHLLRLIRALAMRDGGMPSKDVIQELEHVLQMAPYCAVAGMILALVHAEEVPLLTRLSREDTTLALTLLGEASISICTTARSPLRSVVRRAVPVRMMTQILDVQGFILLKAGQAPEAKNALTSCVRTDPSYATPFVHLAEYCYCQVVAASPFEERRAAMWVGQLCLAIVRELERHPNANTRKAEQLASAFETIKSGQGTDPAAATATDVT
jgi:hypothetical protein